MSIMDTSYVVQGAKLKCTFGSSESNLQIPTDRKVYINGKPQGNIMDFKPNFNIMSFGLCSSIANPAVATATSNCGGVLQRMPCVPEITIPWIYGKSDVSIDGCPAMLNTCTTLCKWAGVITITNDGQ